MKKFILILFVFVISKINLQAQLVVQDSVAASILANQITGGGVAISNISHTPLDSVTMGAFSCSGACNIGLSSGIILTSGSSSVAGQPNYGTGQGFSIGSNLFDLDLYNLSPGTTLADICILEFDFVAVSDTVQFNYVFGSEEYSDYVGSALNDIFGFFISGPGITGNQNIALVPGTTLPIAINNVNNGQSPAGTPPTGPCMNCAYFLDNTLNAYTTAYDGLTTVLTATGGGLQPGQTYHLKLAIADAIDHVFDSGVFLEAGSFIASGPVAMYAGGQRLSSNTVQLCAGSSISLSAPAGFSYAWNTGATTQSISVSQAGSYSVTITGSNSNYTVTSPIINFVVNPNTVPVPVLTQNVNTILSSVNQPIYNYSWTYNGSPVPGANNSTLAFSQTGCYEITVEDPSTGCFMSSDSICVTPTGLNQIENNFIIQFFPNPVNDRLTVNYPAFNNDLVFKIHSLTGKVIIEKTVPANSISQVIDMNKIAQGFYIYSLENNNTIVQSGKLTVIKQQ